MASVDKSNFSHWTKLSLYIYYKLFEQNGGLIAALKIV